MMKSRGIRDTCQTRRGRLYPPVPLPPRVCPPGKTNQPARLQEQARTVSWAAKVAVTLSGFPTQLGERQSLLSAALSAPLCIKTALYVTELLKLRIVVLRQAVLC